MTNALPTAAAPGPQGGAPERWITLNHSSSTYFEERAVQESGATSHFSLDQIEAAYELFGNQRDSVLKVASRPSTP